MTVRVTHEMIERARRAATALTVLCIAGCNEA
jgi:hypothetical protein